MIIIISTKLSKKIINTKKTQGLNQYAPYGEMLDIPKCGQILRNNKNCPLTSLQVKNKGKEEMKNGREERREGKEDI